MGRALPVENGGAAPPSSSHAAAQRPRTALGAFLVKSGILLEAQVIAWEMEAARAEMTRSVPAQE